MMIMMMHIPIYYRRSKKERTEYFCVWLLGSSGFFLVNLLAGMRKPRMLLHGNANTQQQKERWAKWAHIISTCFAFRGKHGTPKNINANLLIQKKDAHKHVHWPNMWLERKMKQLSKTRCFTKEKSTTVVCFLCFSHFIFITSMSFLTISCYNYA